MRIEHLDRADGAGADKARQFTRRFACETDVSHGLCLLAGPVHETALDQKKEQVEAIAEHAGGEDRRIHARHVEQLLRLEHAVAEPVLASR